MTGSIAVVVTTLHRKANTIKLLQFEPSAQLHQVLVNTYTFPGITGPLEQSLSRIMEVAGNRNVTSEVCDIIEQALNAIPLPNNYNENVHEKLAIMLINEAVVPLSADAMRAACEFIKGNITVAVVAVNTPIFSTWDFYPELAHLTGGKYMLLEDAPRVLSSVILRTIHEEDTLRQAFAHENLGCVTTLANHTNDTNEPNETTDGVGDMIFDHGLT